MNLSQLFTAAHAKARKVLKAVGGDYRIAFKYALQFVRSALVTCDADKLTKFAAQSWGVFHANNWKGKRVYCNTLQMNGKTSNQPSFYVDMRTLAIHVTTYGVGARSLRDCKEAAQRLATKLNLEIA